MKHRNNKGRFVTNPINMALLKVGFALILLLTILTFVKMGYDVVLVKATDYFKSLETVIVVQNAHADVTWQVKVINMLKDANVDIVMADKIIKCESSWNPKAYHANKNGTYDSGLFQINSTYGYSKETLNDPLLSTSIAIQIIKTRGFKEWVCYQKIK